MGKPGIQADRQFVSQPVSWLLFLQTRLDVFVPRHQTNSCNYEFWPYFVRTIFVSIAVLLIERVEFVYFS